MTQGHRLSIFKGESWGELYDLARDPDESNNLWDEPAAAAIKARLIEELAQEMMAGIDQSPRARKRA